MAAIGAWFIGRLITIFGRTHRRADVGWLTGPVGGDVIGDAPYVEVAAEEGLTVERQSRDGGLVPSFEQLRSERFDPQAVHPLVREFYEHTTRFTMDVWSQTYFPASIGLWLLVKTISRQVNQLNFPLSPLETAHGMVSEIITLRRTDGTVRYTGWFRTLAAGERVLYTGFYMTEVAPGLAAPCVKVVFPMPRGNATVVLRPEVAEDGALLLDSSGRRFGDAGFYRCAARGSERLRVWQVKTLRETFRVYVDRAGVLRCDHAVRFLGLPVLNLHYKICRCS
ncbi:MAG TPA: hypothetical protein VMZ28_11550 [Kofleriaceae bacterium]|nr:hypothetical protein [Kofleriaceae bacterium]